MRSHLDQSVTAILPRQQPSARAESPARNFQSLIPPKQFSPRLDRKTSFPGSRSMSGFRAVSLSIALAYAGFGDSTRTDLSFFLLDVKKWITP